jgi:hypothetical protein
MSIDGITSEINSLLWKNNARHWSFVMVGFGQVLHYGSILWWFSWMIKV